MRRGNLFINLHQPVPVDVTGVAALGRIAQHVRANRGVTAIGGNQEIPRRGSTVGEGDGDASRVLTDAFNAFAELNVLVPPEVQHFALQFRTRHGARATARALDQRGKAKAGEGIAAPVILIGHKAHRAAVGLDDVAHPEVLHAFHPIGPDGDCRTDGLHLFHGLKHGTVDSRLLQRYSGAQAANARANNDCSHASLLLQGVKREEQFAYQAAEWRKARCMGWFCTAKVRKRGENAFL